jgi:hypothetical protein
MLKFMLLSINNMLDFKNKIILILFLLLKYDIIQNSKYKFLFLINK